MSSMTNAVQPLQEVPAESVRTQLERILSTQAFARSPRIQSFLRYVVEETVEGRAKYLKAYSIALNVFGRNEAFDPQSDPLVRVQALRLRRLLDHYYLTDGKGDVIAITLHRGSYVPSICKQRPVLSVAATDSPAELWEEPVIAVFPFNNLSGDSAQDYVADGLSEEIITGLTRFEEIIVLSRHTSFQYKSQAVDIKDLGRKLSVGYILEGSIRKSGDTIRTTVQLLETEKETYLWAENYDRDLAIDDLLAIQIDISDKVVSEVVGTLTFSPHSLRAG